MVKYYYTDKNKKELQTVIKSVTNDNGKCFVELEDSIFYPQGGGQKGDKGTLEVDGVTYNVANTVKDENFNSILVMAESLDESLVDKTVNCTLDWDFRYRQMKLHTCLHVHHVVMQQLLGTTIVNPKLSTIEDGFAVNKYNEDDFDNSIIEAANQKFLEIIKNDIEVVTYADEQNENFRYWKGLDTVIPCGGIHVDKLSEIGEVSIEVNHKKKAVSIKIALK